MYLSNGSDCGFHTSRCHLYYCTTPNTPGWLLCIFFILLYHYTTCTYVGLMQSVFAFRFRATDLRKILDAISVQMRRLLRVFNVTMVTITVAMVTICITYRKLHENSAASAYCSMYICSAAVYCQLLFMFMCSCFDLNTKCFILLRFHLYYSRKTLNHYYIIRLIPRFD